MKYQEELEVALLILIQKPFRLQLYSILFD